MSVRAALDAPSAATLLEEALRAHRLGELDSAQALYEQLLGELPEQVDGWHFLGLLLYQRGSLDAGIAAVRRALDLAPSYADAHSNLANMLIQTGQHEAARGHVEHAIAGAPQSLAPRLALAAVHRAAQQPEQAEALLRVALTHAIDSAEVHMALSETLVQLDRIPEAIEHFWKAVALDPQQNQSHELAGLALSHLGRFEEAATHFRALLEQDPGNAKARHLLATCGATPMPARASDEYLRAAFDQFAPSFEARLAKLEYQVPQLLVQTWRQCIDTASDRVQALDAGCGTGLLGALLRPLVGQLVGIDLSPGMLGHAREGGHYDVIVEGELGAYLIEHPAQFDLIASADTLCYFGDLFPVLAAARGALRPGGWLIYSVEHWDGDPSAYILQCSGRYAHGQDYVQRAMAAAGFPEVMVAAATLRMEGGNPVKGLIFAAREQQGG